MADIGLMIKIPEEIYKQIMEFGFLENTHGKICYKAIKNGISIPNDATNGNSVIKIFCKGIVRISSRKNVSVEFNKNWWNSLYQKGSKE